MRLPHRIGLVSGSLIVSGALVAGPAYAIGPGTTAPTELSTAVTTSAPWPGHPGRRIVRHVVRRGETATGLATRYHAWTRELLALNHLHRRSTIYVGEHLRIPVVLAAVRRARHHAPTVRHVSHVSHVSAHDRRLRAHGWRHYKMTRTQVRALVTRSARAHHVPTNLALAVAWQESGWRQPLVSSAGALGVMQVMPDTGRWMEDYVGRRLHLRDTFDNVAAGVTLLRVLRDNTRHNRYAVGAYYQGLGAVRAHGLFRETRRYVDSVVAIKHNLHRTGRPTG